MSIRRAIQPASRAARGFTIVELLLVLMVITLVACLAITTFFRQPEVTLHSAVELLLEDMLVAKNRALVMHSEVTVTFFDLGNGYEVRGADGELLPNPVGHGDFVRDYTFDGVFEGVSISDIDLGDDRAVTFDRTGLSTEDGTVTVAFGDEERSIELSREGGVRLLLPKSLAAHPEPE